MGSGVLLGSLFARYVRSWPDPPAAPDRFSVGVTRAHRSQERRELSPANPGMNTTDASQKPSQRGPLGRR